MKLHELKSNSGARKNRIRRGRGNGSGRGTFSGRGCKGQNARSGGGVRVGFEGGQTTLLQRMPKRKGFKNPGKITYSVINLSTLEQVFSENDAVSPAALKEKRLIRNTKNPVKVLGNGELSKKLQFTDVLFSAAAKKKAEKAGCALDS